MKDLDPWDFPLKENEIREQLKAVKPLLFEKRLQMFEQYVSVLNFKMDALNTAWTVITEQLDEIENALDVIQDRLDAFDEMGVLV